MSYAKAYIIPYLKKYSKVMAVTVLMGTLALLSAAMLSFVSGYLITRTSERPETILLVYVPIVAVRTFGISRAVFRYVERLIGHNAVLKVLSDMRVKLYHALEPQALFIRERFTTGDLLGALADDIEHLQDVYIRTVFPTLIGLFVLLFAVGGVAAVSVPFALVLFLLLGIIAFVYPLWSLYRMKKYQTAAKAQHSALYRDFTDAIFGVQDWLISGRKQTFTQRFSKQAQASDAAESKLDFWQQDRAFQLQLLTGVIVIVVGLWSGYEASVGHIMPTYIAAFTLAVMPIVEGIIPISHAVERVPVYKTSLQRIDAMQQQTIAPRATEQVPTDSTISFTNVSYTYPGSEQPALRNISLNIAPGEKIAILGKSGAGKSTLMQLLLGNLTATSGEVTIGGVATPRIGEGIYDVASVLNQKPYLFATTVENNIRLGRQDATSEEVAEVVARVGLAPYIDSLPQQLKTQMEETGQRFSGGERQRIALSRILLKDTPIVVLDEPTVGLDPITERMLMEDMLASLSDKTVIWVTHHLTAIEQMDRILFMDDGEIAMLGTHQQLLENNTRYRRLYDLDYGY